MLSPGVCPFDHPPRELSCIIVRLRSFALARAAGAAAIRGLFGTETSLTVCLSRAFGFILKEGTW